MCQHRHAPFFHPLVIAYLVAGYPLSPELDFCAKVASLAHLLLILLSRRGLAPLCRFLQRKSRSGEWPIVIQQIDDSIWKSASGSPIYLRQPYKPTIQSARSVARLFSWQPPGTKLLVICLESTAMARSIQRATQIETKRDTRFACLEKCIF